MIRRKSTEVIAIVLLAVMLLVSCLLPRFAQATGGVAQTYEQALFGTDLITVDIQIAEDDWQDMLENALEEEYHVANVTINGQTFENVGIRTKGNTSLSQVASSDSDRYSFKIEFDHYQDGQTCWGLDKLVLNNLISDATYLKEYFVYDMFAFLDMPASDYGMAEITVNGEPWGIYLALEGVEESFLTRNFGTSAGLLYKPENMGGGGPGGMKGKDSDEVREMMGMDADAQDLPEPPQMPGQDGEQTMPQGQPPEMNDQQQGTQQAEQPPQLPDAAQQPLADGQTDETAQGDWEQKMQERGARGGGGPGGMMGGGGSDLQYTDDDLDSYETIWEGEVMDTDDADHERVVEALKKISEGDLSGLDVDLMCKYMAVQTFVVNLDSLSGNMAHNYYLYEKDGKLALLPWDYNLAFGGFQSGDASSVINFPIDTPVSGVTLEDRPIFAAILNDESACALYHSYLDKLCSEYVQGGMFELTYTKLRGLLDSRVATSEHDPTAFYTADEYTTAVEMLKTVIEKRAESILGQLDGSIPSTTDGQQADADALIDASDINISAMGSQGGGGAPGGGGRGGHMMPWQNDTTEQQDTNQSLPTDADGEQPTHKPAIQDDEQSAVQMPPDGAQQAQTT